MISLMYALVCFPIGALKYSDQKQLEKERALLYYRLKPITGDNQGKNSSRKHEEFGLLACFSYLSQLPFLYNLHPIEWDPVAHRDWQL